MSESLSPNKICRICGLYTENFLPWGENGESPSYDICFCCGTEFGYEDNNLKAILSNREKWLNNGANWFNPDKKPDNWNLEEQLSHIPEKYK